MSKRDLTNCQHCLAGAEASSMKRYLDVAGLSQRCQKYDKVSVLKSKRDNFSIFTVTTVDNKN
jgi:hypothetical protein